MVALLIAAAFAFLIDVLFVALLVFARTRLCLLRVALTLLVLALRRLLLVGHSAVSFGPTRCWTNGRHRLPFRQMDAKG